MPGNEALVTAIVERLRPYVGEAEAPGGLAMIESNLRLLDAMTTDGGAALGEMLASVDRAIAGLESGDSDAAITEADRWGLGPMVRSSIEQREAEKPKPKAKH